MKKAYVSQFSLQYTAGRICSTNLFWSTVERSYIAPSLFPDAIIVGLILFDIADHFKFLILKTPILKFTQEGGEILSFVRSRVLSLAEDRCVMPCCNQINLSCWLIKHQFSYLATWDCVINGLGCCE